MSIAKTARSIQYWCHGKRARTSFRFRWPIWWPKCDDRAPLTNHSVNIHPFFPRGNRDNLLDAIRTMDNLLLHSSIPIWTPWFMGFWIHFTPCNGRPLLAEHQKGLTCRGNLLDSAAFELLGLGWRDLGLFSCAKTLIVYIHHDCSRWAGVFVK